MAAHPLFRALDNLGDLGVELFDVDDLAGVLLLNVGGNREVEVVFLYLVKRREVGEMLLFFSFGYCFYNRCYIIFR